MKLEELKMIPGCMLALVIDNEGKCLACEHTEGKHADAHDRVAQALSEVTSAMDKLAVELELATGRSCLPQEGWAMMGQDLSVLMGNGGFRGVVVRTSRLKGNELMEDLLGIMKKTSDIRARVPSIAGAVKDDK